MSITSRWIWISAAVITATLVLVLPTVRAQESGTATAPALAPKNIRVAVCNAYSILRDFPAITALAENLEKEKIALNAESKRRANEIEALRKQLDTVNPGSKAYNDTRREIEEKELAAKSWEAGQLLERKHRAAEAIDRSYAIMQEAVRAIANEQGFDLAMNRYEPSLANMPPDEMQARILTQTVLYAKDSIDITAQVMERMKAIYAKQGGSQDYTSATSKPAE